MVCHGCVFFVVGKRGVQSSSEKKVVRLVLLVICLFFRSGDVGVDYIVRSGLGGVELLL